MPLKKRFLAYDCSWVWAFLKEAVFIYRGGRIWVPNRPNIFPCRTINLGAIETSKVCIRYRIYSIFWFQKIFWRARTCARTSRIFCPNAKKRQILAFSWKVHISARRARKCAHAQIFFGIRKKGTKSQCNFFLLSISQKLTILAQVKFSTIFWKNQNELKNMQKPWFWTKIMVF